MTVESRVPVWSAALDRESGPLVRLLVRGREALALADEDASRVALFDPRSWQTLAETTLTCAPHQLLAGARGELFVSQPRCNRVARLELHARDGALEVREAQTVALPSEPVALGFDPAERELFVISAYGQTLTGLSLPGLVQTRSIWVEREPRAVSISEDGASAFVSHASGGVVTEVLLENDEVVRHTVSTFHLSGTSVRFSRWHDFDPFGDFVSHKVAHHRPARHFRRRTEGLHGTQGFAVAARAGHVFLPQVLSNPGEATTPAKGYGSAGSPLPSTLQDVAVFSTSERRWNRGGSFAIINGWRERKKNVCRLPRALGFDPLRSRLLVACVGSARVIEYDALARDPARTELRQWSTPAGPSGLALDVENERAYVWSRFDRTISVLDTSGGVESLPEMSPTAVARRQNPTPEGKVLESFPLPPLAEREQALLLGNALFHTTGDPRISADGRACASCHPAGRDDGLSWRTGDALSSRQTPMLDGRIAGTAPYGWLGQHETLEQHLHNTIEHRLGGKGLDADAFAALAEYVKALPGPPVERAPLDASATRGRDLFRRSDVGCADCHYEDGGVDGIQYALTGETATDTPSLRFLAGGAPYFHDGRFGSLDAVLEHTAGKMGQSTPLDGSERADLVAYLSTL